MMRDEFQTLLGKVVTNEEWDVIHEVYQFHPSITNVEGKKQIVKLYKDFGFKFLSGLYPQARMIEELEAERATVRVKIARIYEANEAEKNKVIAEAQMKCNKMDYVATVEAQPIEKRLEEIQEELVRFGMAGV